MRVEATFNQGIDGQGISDNNSKVTEIRGAVSSVADARVWETGIRSTNLGGSRLGSRRNFGVNTSGD